MPGDRDLNCLGAWHTLALRLRRIPVRSGSRYSFSRGDVPLACQGLVWSLALVLAGALTSFCLPLPALGANDAEAKLAEAERAIAQGRSEPAVRLLTEALTADPKLADAWYLRGRENFRLGRGEQSVADFDRYIQLRPELASRQWERGISCYYAGKFAEGAKQFELYQTYHDNDVENSVWRYVCMARLDGPEKARRAMLPIANDTRVPMMEVYRMFRGELTPDQVLAAVDRDQPSDDVRAGRLFYARLYLGLYYEAQGQRELAGKYILLAADEHRETRRVNRYMWDVARIHAQQYRQPGAAQNPNR